METELRNILTKIYKGQKENNDEAVEQILLLLSVLGRSEQLVCSCGKQMDWLDNSLRYCANCFKTNDETIGKTN